MDPLKISPSTKVGELRAALADFPQDAPVAVLYKNLAIADVALDSEHGPVPWLPTDTVFLRASHP